MLTDSEGNTRIRRDFTPTHKHRGHRGRSVGSEPRLADKADGRPTPHEPGHSPGIVAHGRRHDVRSQTHTVSMGQARRRDHSPAMEMGLSHS